MKSRASRVFLSAALATDDPAWLATCPAPVGWLILMLWEPVDD